jgi:DNA excision repair protein ERCC-3
MVGIATMEKLQTATLILTANTVASRQWIAELVDKTDLAEDAIGEYSGLRKQIRPVTVATYQIMTYRPRKRSDRGQTKRPYPHFALFSNHDWGLIIYDEVHLLPAPVFRITAEIQARRRLGLTATLVREDGRETDVFSLIGPKKYDAPWKDLERQGWIAAAECHEIRISLPDDLRLSYALTDDRGKYRVAAENPRKLDVLQQLLVKHQEDSILVLGMYLGQLEEVSERYGYPLVTGRTRVKDRQRLYQAFRDGEIGCLVVSKVGNFAIDLPDASVAIQISGTFGSRQEEAQRLGRILRPKRDGLLAHFYTLVTRESRDEAFAAKRQLFLTEQGYRYDILYEDELQGWQPALRAVHRDSK